MAKQIANNYDVASGDKNFNITDAININSMTINVIYSGITGGDMTLTLQQSPDGVNWKNVLDADDEAIQLTLSTTGTHEAVSITDMSFDRCRLALDVGDATAGTISAIYITKI